MKIPHPLADSERSTATPVNRRALMKWLVAGATGASWGTILKAEDSAGLQKNILPTASKPQRQAVYISPTARRHGKFAQIAFKMASEDTDGLLGSAELVLEPGTIGAVPHLHRGFDEICRVLEGTVHILVDKEVTAVPAGGWHLRPRGPRALHERAGGFVRERPARARFRERLGRPSRHRVPFRTAR
jgi:mannose-6-phosphate isomerase-like protein (cupin superfamily)